MAERVASSVLALHGEDFDAKYGITHEEIKHDVSANLTYNRNADSGLIHPFYFVQTVCAMFYFVQKMISVIL